MVEVLGKEYLDYIRNYDDFCKAPGLYSLVIRIYFYLYGLLRFLF